MKVYSRNNWDITHSLTPQPQLVPPKKNYEINMPQIPEVKKIVCYAKYKSLNNQGSRKRRLMEQRNTEIQKTNRMLYEKIRKIMQKRHSSERKISPPDPQVHFEATQENLTTSNKSQKALSLPQINQSRTSRSISQMQTSRSELTTILSNRQQFAQKYFQQLTVAKEKLTQVHTEQLHNLEVKGWRVKILLLNHGEYVIIRGKKGSKQITKKYIYQKVKKKLENNLQQWISSKLQLQI